MKIPILYTKDLRLRKVISYVSQEYTADNHICLIPNSILLHSMLQFLPKDV